MDLFLWLGFTLGIMEFRNNSVAVDFRIRTISRVKQNIVLKMAQCKAQFIVFPPNL